MTDMGQADRSLRFTPSSDAANEAVMRRWRERQAAILKVIQDMGFESVMDVPQDREPELLRRVDKQLQDWRDARPHLDQLAVNRLASALSMQPGQVEDKSPNDQLVMLDREEDGRLTETLVSLHYEHGQPKSLSVSSGIFQGRARLAHQKTENIPAFSMLEGVIRGHLAALKVEAAHPAGRHTVLVTNNAFDVILLVDANDIVLSAWMANADTIRRYIDQGAQPNAWEVGQWYMDPNPDNDEDAQIADAMSAIDSYGDEVGRDGAITDEKRKRFWLGDDAPGPTA